MAFFGQKTYFKNFFLGYFCPPIKVMSKNWVKMASKLFFIGAGRICPPCHSGCIPDAASCRVKNQVNLSENYIPVPIFLGCVTLMTKRIIKDWCTYQTIFFIRGTLSRLQWFKSYTVVTIVTCDRKNRRCRRSWTI